MRLLRTLATTVTALALSVVTVPADAGTRSSPDGAPDGAGVPAAYDLIRVRWDYTDEALVVTSRLASVRRKGVALTSRAAHAGEGYEVEVRSWWRDGRRIDRLWIAYNTVSQTRVDCPGLRSRWRVQRDVIRVVVPHACLFESYPLDGLRVSTGRLGSSGEVDVVASPQLLTSG